MERKESWDVDVGSERVKFCVDWKTLDNLIFMYFVLLMSFIFGCCLDDIRLPNNEKQKCDKVLLVMIIFSLN